VTERCKDLVGRRVRLTDDLELRSGKRYPKGSEWVVTGSWRGAFSLEEPSRSAWPKIVIYHCPRHRFELVKG